MTAALRSLTDRQLRALLAHARERLAHYEGLGDCLFTAGARASYREMIGSAGTELRRREDLEMPHSAWIDEVYGNPI